MLGQAAPEAQLLLLLLLRPAGPRAAMQLQHQHCTAGPDLHHQASGPQAFIKG